MKTATCTHKTFAISVQFVYNSHKLGGLLKFQEVPIRNTIRF